MPSGSRIDKAFAPLHLERFVLGRQSSATSGCGPERPCRICSSISLDRGRWRARTSIERRSNVIVKGQLDEKSQLHGEISQDADPGARAAFCCSRSQRPGETSVPRSKSDHIAESNDCSREALMSSRSSVFGRSGWRPVPHDAAAQAAATVRHGLSGRSHPYRLRSPTSIAIQVPGCRVGRFA